MEISNPELEALQLALKMEGDGRQFFLEARDKATHPLAKETFQSLAEWELEHMRIIEQFHASLKDTGEWESVEQLQTKKGEATKTFKTAFQKVRENIDETVKAKADDLEAYRIAKDIESKLIVFYQEQAKQTSSNNAKRFYDFMADQEREHYQILDNSLQYLENPAQWFERGEWLF
jgi:rubrerythrin